MKSINVLVYWKKSRQHVNMLHSPSFIIIATVFMVVKSGMTLPEPAPGLSFSLLLLFTASPAALILLFFFG